MPAVCHSPRYNQKFLQMLPNVPWRQSPPLVENHGSDGTERCSDAERSPTSRGTSGTSERYDGMGQAQPEEEPFNSRGRGHVIAISGWPGGGSNDLGGKFSIEAAGDQLRTTDGFLHWGWTGRSALGGQDHGGHSLPRPGLEREPLEHLENRYQGRGSGFSL